MIAEYKNMIEIVNKNISKFNEFFIPEKQVPTIDLSRINDNEYFTELNVPWLELVFPNAPKKGVYFIFGYDPEDRASKVMYIGKASFSSSIGGRLYAHLLKDKDNPNFTMNGINGRAYNLEYVFGLDLEFDDMGMEIFASALEEFLILNVKNEILLLKGTGNYD